VIVVADVHRPVDITAWDCFLNCVAFASHDCSLAMVAVHRLASRHAVANQLAARPPIAAHRLSPLAALRPIAVHRLANPLVAPPLNQLAVANPLVILAVARSVMAVC
jgi:hypothetical protein